MSYRDDLAWEMARQECGRAEAAGTGLPFDQIAPEFQRAHAASHRRAISDVFAAITVLAERGGPKLVRQQPEPDMVDAAVADAVEECVDNYWCRRIWLTMHDAAPAVPEE